MGGDGERPGPGDGSRRSLFPVQPALDHVSILRGAGQRDHDRRLRDGPRLRPGLLPPQRRRLPGCACHRREGPSGRPVLHRGGGRGVRAGVPGGRGRHQGGGGRAGFPRTRDQRSLRRRSGGGAGPGTGCRGDGERPGHRRLPRRGAAGVRPGGRHDQAPPRGPRRPDGTGERPPGIEGFHRALNGPGRGERVPEGLLSKSSARAPGRGPGRALPAPGDDGQGLRLPCVLPPRHRRHPPDPRRGRVGGGQRRSRAGSWVPRG